MVDSVGCEGTAGSFSACHPPAFFQQPLCLFGRAVPHPYIAQFVLIVGVAMTQVQNLELGFIEPHEVLLGPLPEPV